MLILEIIISLILLVMVYQDFKYRAISWFLIPVIFVIIVIDTLQHIELKEFAYNSLINLGIVAIEFLLITLYFSIKNKSLTNIVNKYIGIGDILFFIPLCIFFSPVNFVVFKLVSLFLTLIVFIIYILITKRVNIKIPMAGTLSIALVLIIILKNIFNSEIQNDDYMLNTLIQYLGDNFY